MPSVKKGPAKLVAGSGPDTLVLKLSQDAWRGNAQYTVKVDGQQVGDIFTASALHGSGQSDTLTLKGDWGPGVHKVEVTFLNDAYGGSPSADRNLYLDGATYNGVSVSGAKANLWDAGTASFDFTDTDGGAPAKDPGTPAAFTAGDGPDTLVLKLSQDAWQGSAQYTVKVDGQQVGDIFTASALHGSGQSDTLTLKGDWGPGVHKVEVTFLNDAYGGSPSADRNLHLDGATYNGVSVSGATASLWNAGTASFDFTEIDGAVPAPPGDPRPNADLGRAVTLTFNDNFDTFSWDAGHYRWNAETGRKDWVSDADGGTWATQYHWGRNIPANEELGFYSDATVGVHPFSIDNGALVITAAPSADPSKTNGLPYTTGAITTAGSFVQKYGYFEMRADLQPGQGLWPGFWLLNEDQRFPPEIDIIEAINNEDWIAQSLHATGPDGQIRTTQHFEVMPDLHEGYHTFAVSWRPEAIEWYVDGRKTFSTPTPADAHSPMYLLAQLAIGGKWPGSPDATTSFPAEMRIDHIRAWQYDDLM